MGVPCQIAQRINASLPLIRILNYFDEKLLRRGSRFLRYWDALNQFMGN